MDETDFELAPECDIEQPAFWANRIEVALGATPLAEFAAGCFGATRFIQCGEDAPDWVLSCAWHAGGAWVEYVAGFAGWNGTGKVVGRWQTRLATGLLPWRLRNWRRVSEAVAAPSCQGKPMIGGPYYYHGLYTEGQSVVVRWAWPLPELHRRQWELVGDYGWVRLAGWWRSWFPVRMTRTATPRLRT
jgi:hypothetical protein